MNAIIIALIIPFLGTSLGAAFVFFMKKEIPELSQKVLLGFASGVMVAAAVWSLILPAIEQGGIWTVTFALLGGFAFLFLIDLITPHIHPKGGREGPMSKLSRTTMLALAVTIHNFPEGMAVGVTIAGATASQFSMTEALALSVGIAIQNIPEGAIISMPLRNAGNSRIKAFGIGTLSGVVEPIGSILVILLASMATAVMPYLLSFAAGAMLYVVIEELIPEASQGKHSNLGTIGFALGFAMMMVLDQIPLTFFEGS